MRKSTLVGFLAIFFVSGFGTEQFASAEQYSQEIRSKLIGRPSTVQVLPHKLHLNHPRSLQQIIVTGEYPGDTVRDLTPFCDFQIEDPKIARITPSGLISPAANGRTELLVSAGDKKVRVPLTISNMDAHSPVSFRHEIIASLSVGGCNSGACHGTPSGKNGFRLSLRGYDPAEDLLQLTRDVMGRRTSRHNPDASLILMKALAKVPHEGGQRFPSDSLQAKLIRQWLQEDLQDDPKDLPSVEQLEILPGSRVLRAPARRQQIAVLAHFSDGKVKDVSQLTVFTTSDNDTASVDGNGLVEFHKAGEVAILCRYLQSMQSVRLAYLEPKDGFVWPNPPENNYVDRHVFSKLKLLNIQPSDLCSDEEFIRRAYLDVCATLPSPDEVRGFLKDKSADKRAKLIDRLLNRSEYADFWTLKWMDVLRNKTTTLGREGAKRYRKWMKNHIQQNTPFDRVVRELLTAEGNTFRNGPANYYRVTTSPEELAESTAQLFFGVRMQCAKCHNHPFEKWTQDDYYSTASFFARIRRQGDRKRNKKNLKAQTISVSNSGDVRHLRTGQVMQPRFLGGEVPEIDRNQDRREVLAKWLTRRGNPFFARSVVNRIWFHLMGQGIVDPVDDFRDSNPSANDELLDALAKDFVAHNFDVKHIIRTIANSRTYQLSATTNDFNKDDSKYFSHARTKMLTAEQLLDAICTVTEVPADFRGKPNGTRAIQLVGGEVSHPFLKSFGQPARELPCECERGGSASLAQALQLVNGKTVSEQISHRRNRIGRLLEKKIPDEKMLEELYLAGLSRFPTQKEQQTVLNYLKSVDDRRQGWEDVLWTLLNTKEFMFRH